MKRITIFLVLVFCLAGLFAEAPKYTEQNLLDYLVDKPGSSLPAEGERIEVSAGLFSIESADIDGPGMDYIVKFVGARLSPRVFSKLIYIYSEDMKTEKLWQEQTIIINAETMFLFYTGKTAPAVNGSGNRVELPIFIAKGL